MKTLILAIACLDLLGSVAAQAQGSASDPAGLTRLLLEAEALLQRAGFEEASDRLQVVLKAKPNDGLAHNLLGRVRAAQKRWAEAVASFGRAAELLPQDGVVRQNLGIAHFELRDVLAADRELKEALRLKPDLSLPELYLGRMAEEAGDADSAEQAFRRAVKAAPQDPWVYYFLGGLHFRERRNAAAIEAFRKCLELSPDLPSAHWNLGLALARDGKKEESQLHFDRFKKLADFTIKNQSEMFRVTSRLQMAQREISGGRPEAALPLLFEAKEMVPNLPAVHLLLQMAYERQGLASEAKAAREEYERLLQQAK